MAKIRVEDTCRYCGERLGEEFILLAEVAHSTSQYTYSNYRHVKLKEGLTMVKFKPPVKTRAAFCSLACIHMHTQDEVY